MTDAEMIAALADRLSPEELKTLASKLKGKKRKEIVPSAEEIADFEKLWEVRREYTKRPGDPKRTALLAYCRRMREKPAPLDEIIYGIRNEYSAKKDAPSFYCQMATFMSQRRWENYDYAKALESMRRLQEREQQQNVVQMRAMPAGKTRFMEMWEQKKKESA